MRYRFFAGNENSEKFVFGFLNRFMKILYRFFPNIERVYLVFYV